MVFLISLLIGTQILCSLAVSPTRQECPPPPSAPLISLPCDSPSVKAVAELALDQLNADRKEGYVLGLQRIFDAHQVQWGDKCPVYLLILDVLETHCHVLSRKSWKACPFRLAYETVYGQCNITFYINKPSRTHHVLQYNCALHQLPASAITKFCPDCPVPSDPTQPRFLEAATLSLAKFNSENNHSHYFNIRNVTRARMQWVVGPSLFVEYIIQETSCSKSQAVPDVSKCPFLPYEKADVGVCKGSVVDSHIENRKFVSADCEIFHAQPPTTEGQQTDNRKPGHQEDDHPSPRKNGLHDHQHQGRHPRDHHHGHHSHDHTDHDTEMTVGPVRVLLSSNAHEPETRAEQLDPILVPPELKRPKHKVIRPNIRGASEERHPWGKPGLTKPARPGTHPPFPTRFSQEESCPGEILVSILGLEPLLPKRPVEASPTGATKFQAKENVKP